MLDTEVIIRWFLENKRDLPWRHTDNPYAIWVSEIMLQQTRVEAVKPYYLKFLERLPNIASLADIAEEELLKLWEGLGYYSRVKNMQQAAKTIQEKYNGNFPRNYDDVLSLKGIGVYSAGAILSRAFHLPYASVDGNVLRVLTRYEANDADISLEKTKKEYKEKLESLHPSDFGNLNEALMELGATICTPKNPLCNQCPLVKNCRAYHQNLISCFPVKKKKVKVVEKEYTCLFFYDEEQRIYFEKKETNLLKGLHAPYLLEGFYDEIMLETFLAEKMGLKVQYMEQLNEQKHIFTHQIWYMRGFKILLKEVPHDMHFFDQEAIKKKISIPTCFRKFFFELDIL